MDFREAFENHKWQAEALRCREDWPPKLQMLVEIMLDSQVPMFILWGPKKNILFNSPFADAHELNQPLAAIANYAEGSRKLLEDGGDAGLIAQGLEGVTKSAERAGNIIRHLRHMTMGGPVKSSPTDIESIISESISLATMGDCANVEIEYICSNDKLVVADAIQLQQVLLNLIRNSCEAVRSISGGRVLISSVLADEMVVIKVEDNGPGFEKEELSELFDAFFSTKRDGMGVGLSISRTIIEAHGGKISATNRPEGGACFAFTLPRAAA